MLKKAKPLNKLRPDERGSPFAVRELAFLTTSFPPLRGGVRRTGEYMSSLSYLSHKEKPFTIMVRASPKKMKKMYVVMMTHLVVR